MILQSRVFAERAARPFARVSNILFDLGAKVCCFKAVCCMYVVTQENCTEKIQFNDNSQINK